MLEFNRCEQFGDGDKNIQTCPQNSVFHVVEKARTAANSTKMKNACANRAKLVLFIVKYANLRDCCRRPRRGWMTSAVSNRVDNPVIKWTTGANWGGGGGGGGCYLFLSRFPLNPFLFCFSWGINAGLSVGKKHHTLLNAFAPTLNG